MKVFVTGVILGFRVALIMDVRADAIAQLDFGKTVQPSFISLVNILAHLPRRTWVETDRFSFICRGSRVGCNSPNGP